MKSKPKAHHEASSGSLDLQRFKRRALVVGFVLLCFSVFVTPKVDTLPSKPKSSPLASTCEGLLCTATFLHVSSCPQPSATQVTCGRVEVVFFIYSAIGLSATRHSQRSEILTRPGLN